MASINLFATGASLLQDYMDVWMDEFDNELQRQVFAAVYNSGRQRLLRGFAGVMLGLKHALRGMLFSWPLYALALAALYLPGNLSLLFVLFILPGLLVSGYILAIGVHSDYAERVSGVILNKDRIRHLLLPRD